MTGAGRIGMGVLIAGVDEVGRGPLAGPLVAAAVILDPARPIAGLTDSKQLSAHRRAALAVEIRERALAWSLGRAEVDEIDAINVFQANLLAMQRAVAALPLMPEEVLVDGNRCPRFACPARAIVGGDRCNAAISAASIIAKVARDREMCDWATRYHHYGFERHKGYGTAVHLTALRRYGPCPIHRHTFAPVRELLDGAPWSPLPQCRPAHR